jgi:hypothetical protein
MPNPTLYPSTVTPPRPPSKFEQRASQAKTMYGNAYEPACVTFRARLQARYRGDAEAIRDIGASIPQLTAFAAKRGMKPEDLAHMLSRVREYVDFPRDEATQNVIAAKSWGGMRMARGSSEEAAADVAKFNVFIQDLRREVPYVGKLATENGARVDRDFIEIGASYSAAPK